MSCERRSCAACTCLGARDDRKEEWTETVLPLLRLCLYRPRPVALACFVTARIGDQVKGCCAAIRGFFQRSSGCGCICTEPHQNRPWLLRSPRTGHDGTGTGRRRPAHSRDIRARAVATRAGSVGPAPQPVIPESYPLVEHVLEHERSLVARHPRVHGDTPIASVEAGIRNHPQTEPARHSH